MEQIDNMALMSAYITAVGNKEIDKLNDLLSDQLHFEGPFMSFDAKAPYIDALNRLGRIVERNEIREIICNDANNCVLYNLVAIKNAGYVPCLEWVTIAEGKITSIKLLFDKEKFVGVSAAAHNG